MKVTHVIRKKEWEESHRGRSWVSPEKAARKLRQKALRPLVKKLVASL
jgi:hypothetical protein